MSSLRDAVRPPAFALRLLQLSVPATDRDDVVGDLLEVFDDRVDARRRFNRAWFAGIAVLFAAHALATSSAQILSPLSRRLLMGRIATGFLHAARRLRHEWRYTLAVLLILGVGIGPAAAMLSVFERVLLRPLDFFEPERLGLIRIDIGQLSAHPGLSPAEGLDLRRAEIFEAVEVETRLAEASLGTGPEFIPLSQLSFTIGMLPMLGVTPVVGRNFVDDDIPPPPAPGTPPPPPGTPPPPQKALLDYGMWQTHFGGDRDVLGRVITVNGRQTEIIGVLPDGFRIVTGRAIPQRIDVYTPLRLGDFRNSWQFPTLVRLKRGQTFDAAQAALDAVAVQNRLAFPQFYEERVRYTIAPVLDDMTRTTAPALRAGVAGVALLLVIAIATATALVVARLRTRDRDFAIRAAIGASRGALVLDVLTEGVLLAGGGAAVGAVLALAAIAGVREVIPRTVPRWDDIRVGWDLVLYSAGLSAAGLVLSGLIPVVKASRRAMWQSLRTGSVQSSRPERATSRLVLVGAQMALTVVLAFGCLQLMRSAAHLSRVDLGFDADVLTLRVPYDFVRYPRTERAALYQRIRDRVKQVPGVNAAGVTTHPPLGGAVMMDGYETDLSKEPSFEPYANYHAVTPGYFETLKIPFVQGRDFTDAEDAQSQPVVIVDETLARSAFPGESNVIGRQLRLGWGLSNARIVGVVGHVRSIEIGRQVRAQIYAPIGNLFLGAGNITVRADRNVQALEPAIVKAINEVGPGRAVASTSMLSSNVDAATSTLRAVTGLVTVLAVSAGLLSGVGLYLVIAYVVHERRRATAIRSALGASRAQVMWPHLRTSAAILAGALPVGVVLSLFGAPLFAGLVYGVGQRDIASLAFAAAIAVVAGMAGTWLPVRRATRTNLVSLLREG